MALPVLKGNTSTKEAQLLVILKIINLCILYLCWWWVLDAPVGPRDGGALIQTHTGAAGGGWTRVEDAGWSTGSVDVRWRTGCSGCRDDAGWSADALGEGWRTGCSGCRDDAGWSTGSVDVRWRTGGLEVRCFGFWWLRQQQENLLQCSCIICLDFIDINRAEEHTHIRGSHTKRAAPRSATSRTTRGIAHQTRTIYTNKWPEVCCNGCVLVNSVGCNWLQWM